jgi:hypothetical protein
MTKSVMSKSSDRGASLSGRGSGSRSRSRSRMRNHLKNSRSSIKVSDQSKDSQINNILTLPKKEKGKFQLNGSYSNLLTSSEDDNDLSIDKGMHKSPGQIGGMKEVFTMNVNRMQTLRR